MIADSNGLPIAINLSSASPHEVNLVNDTINSIYIERIPGIIIGDKAYDSDPLDEYLLKERKIELIAPHKENRKKKQTQDNRKLRRYAKRWKIERLFAWLQSFRRILIRHEVKHENFLAFIQLACTIILLRYL